MSQNLSSAAVMIGTLRVKTCFTVYCTSIKDPGILFLPECHLTREIYIHMYCIGLDKQNFLA